MSKNRLNSRQFLPAAVNGVDFRNPIFRIPPGQSPMMFNWLPANGKLVKRNRHAQISLNHALDGSPPLVIAYTDGETVTPIAIGKSFAISPTANSAVPAGFQPTLEASLLFRDQLLVTHGIGGVVYQLNPTTLAWTAGLTFTSGGKSSICAHRERVYVGSGKNLYYGGVGAYTAAAMTPFSVSSLIVGDISSIKSLSISVTGTLDHILVIVSILGEVLIYAGTYPGATDWTLINKFNVDIERSLSPDFQRFVELIEVPGDILIVPTGGFSIFSLKELISGKVGVSDVFAPIRPLFDTLAGYSSSNVEYRGSKFATYWPTRNSLVVIVSATWTNWDFGQRWSTYFETGPDVSGGALYGITNLVLLYDYTQQVWTMHTLNNYDGVFNTLAATRDYVLAPGIASMLRLFDSSGGISWYLDYGTDTIQSFVSLVPASENFENKKANAIVLYGLEQNDVQVSYGTQMSFDVSPATLTTFDYSNEFADKVTGRWLDVTGVDHSVQVQILHGDPDSESPFRWEFYGIDVLLESGGEING